MNIINKVVTYQGLQDALAHFSTGLQHLGEYNYVKGQTSFGWGDTNQVIGNGIFTFGTRNHVSGHHNIVCGVANAVNGPYNIVIGNSNESAIEQSWARILGDNCHIYEAEEGQSSESQPLYLIGSGHFYQGVRTAPCTLVGYELSAGDGDTPHHSNTGPIVCKIGSRSNWLAFTQSGGAVLSTHFSTYTLVQEKNSDTPPKPTQYWYLRDSDDQKLCCGPGIYELSVPDQGVAILILPRNGNTKALEFRFLNKFALTNTDWHIRAISTTGDSWNTTYNISIMAPSVSDSISDPSCELRTLILFE